MSPFSRCQPAIYIMFLTSILTLLACALLTCVIQQWNSWRTGWNNVDAARKRVIMRKAQLWVQRAWKRMNTSRTIKYMMQRMPKVSYHRWGDECRQVLMDVYSNMCAVKNQVKVVSGDSNLAPKSVDDRSHRLDIIIAPCVRLKSNFASLFR
jgi:hypothetical protein